jgi:hypothetical protein
MATEMKFGLLGAIIVRDNGVVPTVPPGQSKATNDAASLCSPVLDRSAGAAVMIAAHRRAAAAHPANGTERGRGIGAHVHHHRHRQRLMPHAPVLPTSTLVAIRTGRLHHRHQRQKWMQQAEKICHFPWFGFPAPLRILCLLSSGNRRTNPASADN